MKRNFFQARVVSILLYGCTTRTLTKRLGKKLDGNYTRMWRAILNKSWRQHPTKHQIYGQLHPITKTIKARRTRHAGHCWGSRDELISDVLLCTPTYGWAKAGRPAWTYIQLYVRMWGCSPKDLLEAMNDKGKWRERVRDIRASGTTWWWRWHICICVVGTCELFFKISINWQYNNPLLYMGVLLVVKMLDDSITVSNCERSLPFTFPFWLISFGKKWKVLCLQLRVKKYHCCSTWMVLVINDL